MIDKKLIAFIFSGVAVSTAVLIGNQLVNKLADKRALKINEQLIDFEARLYAYKTVLKMMANGEYEDDAMGKMPEDYEFYKIAYRLEH